MRHESKVYHIFITLVIIVFLTGCDIPKNMQVRSGIDPRFVDDDVRFRTSYYFTVVNICYDKNGKELKQPGLPKIDAVYRYRMTGKADSLFTSVKFEAGTLHKDAIDPFGLTKTIRPGEGLPEIDQDPNKARGPKPTTDRLACPAGSTAGKGFRVLGPEGWRYFNQDERLILAMSSSSQPLVDTLNKIATIARQSGRDAPERLLPYLDEEARTLEAIIQLKDAPGSDVSDFGVAWDEALNTLSISSVEPGNEDDSASDQPDDEETPQDSATLQGQSGIVVSDLADLPGGYTGGEGQ